MDIIKVEKRDMTVKAKHLRKMGIVPCSVYGGALKEAVSIQIPLQVANTAFRSIRDGSRVQLELDGETLHAQVKEYTRNPDNHNIEHISFQALQAGHPVRSVAQIYRKNAEKVNGVLEQMIDEVAYEALPRNMIDSVTLDLEGKGIGTVITLADIPELNNDKITLQMPLDSIVLRITEAQTIPDEDEEADETAAE